MLDAGHGEPGKGCRRGTRGGAPGDGVDLGSACLLSLLLSFTSPLLVLAVWPLNILRSHLCGSPLNVPLKQIWLIAGGVGRKLGLPGHGAAAGPRGGPRMAQRCSTLISTLVHICGHVAELFVLKGSGMCSCVGCWALGEAVGGLSV